MVIRQNISDEVWNDNYRAPGESSLADTWERQAKACSEIESEDIREKVYKDFLWLLTDFKGIAGGRITANLGVTGREATSLMNCFVHNPSDIKYQDPDSLSGIYDMLKAQALTLKSEGGYGMNFSWIRPSGSYVSGIGGRTPGVLKFMELWDKSSEVITMGSEKSSGKKADEKKKIRKGAQMGILECIAGSSLISTINGRVSIKDLVGKTPYVYCTDCKGNVFVRQASKIWSNGKRKVIKVFFDNDDFIICTPDHKILLSNGSYKEAGKLVFGDSISALRKRIYNKYLQLGITGYRKCIPEHVAVAELKYGRYPLSKIANGAFLPESEELHHIDCNTTNNSIDNIELLTRSEHAKEHGRSNDFVLRKYQRDLAESRKGKSDIEWYGEKKSRLIQEKRIASRRSNGTNVPWNKGSVEYKNHYQNGFKNQFSQKLADDTNHKVITVEDYGEEEVFDMSVPDFHNFVANGVFIHNCWHPEIEDFIVAKQTAGRLSKFNISVGICRGFMEAVENNTDWDLVFPNTHVPEHKQVWAGDIEDWKSRGLPIVVYKTVKARDLWDNIMKSTYNRNDPGVLFLDIANKYNPLGYAENIVTTNPCGEVSMSTGVCLLLSLNLVKYLKETDDGFEFDFETFKRASEIAVRFSDNINDISRVPLDDYKISMVEKRRIGIGVVGLGSLLAILGLRYGSKESIELVTKIFKTKAETEILASARIGQEKGSFPLFDKLKYFNSYWWKTLPISEKVKREV
ncbi:MAG: HNH endonuclease, partial [Candidatus Paceibacterota bacterium]